MRSEVFTVFVRRLELIRQIIWLALTGYVVFLVGILYVMFHPSAPPYAAFTHPFTIPLAVLSVAAIGVSHWIPNWLLPDARLRELLSHDPDLNTLARNPRGGEVNAERLDQIKRLPKQEQRLLGVAQAFFTPFIVRLALHESVALYGFVLGYLSHSVLPIVPFAAAAMALNLTISPKLDSSFERATRLCPAA